jgi:hypothetical protein
MAAVSLLSGRERLLPADYEPRQGSHIFLPDEGVKMALKLYEV